MLCPLDRSPLAESSFEGHPIHRCPQCSGVSVSGSLLREVRAHTALELHKGQGDASVALTCPSDGTAMKGLEYKKVPVCTCPQCFRLWLEPGTLSRLLDIVAPPRQEDLSRIGHSLAAVASRDGLSGLDGLGDIFDLTGDVLNTIGN
jgi:Zn-finger nucleic acid-binding protein